jgi:hypothetical protein
MHIPFALPAGLNSDDTKYAAKGDGAEAKNVRFWTGKAQVIGRWLVLGVDAILGIC